LIHLRFAHAARGDGRRADTDAAGDHRRILVERDRVLVHGDARLAERRFGDFPGQTLGEHVDEHEMVVGAAAHEAKPVAAQRGRKSCGVGDNLPLILAKGGFQRLPETDGFGRDDVHQRTALHSGKHSAVEIFCVLLAAENETGTRAAQRLVRR
jgi:hypothetical protein